MAFWSGRREIRLMSVTGDATGSTVMYLPGSKILATGDVLVSPEDGNGPPPWTTQSYSITDQVRAALAQGAVSLKAVQAAVNVDAIGREYSADGKLSDEFHPWLLLFTKKVAQEALDGAISER